MPDLTPRQLAVYGLALLALILLAVWYVGRGNATAAAPAGAPPIAVQGESTGAVVVHVAGAVRHPGVYRMRAGSRVDDAVQRAGGARARADLSALNLAAELEDGRQVLVPLRAGAVAAAAGGARPGGSAAAASTRGAATAAGSATALAPAVPLNLNTATPDQLDQLDGIGPMTAHHIIEYREAHNGFGSVEELDQVPGIGEARLAALRDKVRV
jgi:competence protein ComEA